MANNGSHTVLECEIAVSSPGACSWELRNGTVVLSPLSLCFLLLGAESTRREPEHQLSLRAKRAIAGLETVCFCFDLSMQVRGLWCSHEGWAPIVAFVFWTLLKMRALWVVVRDHVKEVLQKLEAARGVGHSPSDATDASDA